MVTADTFFNIGEEFKRLKIIECSYNRAIEASGVSDCEGLIMLCSMIKQVQEDNDQLRRSNDNLKHSLTSYLSSRDKQALTPESLDINKDNVLAILKSNGYRLRKQGTDCHYKINSIHQLWFCSDGTIKLHRSDWLKSIGDIKSAEELLRYLRDFKDISIHKTEGNHEEV